MASLLKLAGYRIVYSGVKEYEEMIIKSGFEYYVINPFILTPITQLKYQSKGWFLIEIITNLYTKSRLSEAKNGFENLQDLINKLQPDLVIIDIHKVIIKALFYQSRQIPIVSVHTTFDVKWMPNVPPINSYFIPGKSFFSVVFTSILFFSTMVTNRILNEFIELMLLRQGSFRIILKFYKGIGLNIRGVFDFNRSMGFSVKNLHRLILAPTPLEFQTSKRQNTYNVGPLLEIERENKISDIRYNSLIQKVESVGSNMNSFIVYCSMGTLAGLAKKKNNRFYKRMAQVAKLNPDFLFILSIGAFIDVNELLPVPINMFVFESVPQINMLKYSDLMITHGGASSLAECVMSEVPMIVYPYGKQTDIPSNSARVVFHKIGLRGNITWDSAKKISRKINQIKSNYQFYLSNIRRMKEKFEEKNQSTEVVNIIESIINNHAN